MRPLEDSPSQTGYVAEDKDLEFCLSSLHLLAIGLQACADGDCIQSCECPANCQFSYSCFGGCAGIKDMDYHV